MYLLIQFKLVQKKKKKLFTYRCFTALYPFHVRIFIHGFPSSNYWYQSESPVTSSPHRTEAHDELSKNINNQQFPPPDISFQHHFHPSLFSTKNAMGKQVFPHICIAFSIRVILFNLRNILRRVEAKTNSTTCWQNVKYLHFVHWYRIDSVIINVIIFN